MNGRNMCILNSEGALSLSSPMSEGSDMHRNKCQKLRPLVGNLLIDVTTPIVLTLRPLL